MSREVDFTVSNFASQGRILRPGQQPIPRPSKPGASSQAPPPTLKPSSSSLLRNSITIEKSIPSTPVPAMPQAHRKILQPEIESLKHFAKQKVRREREISKLIAQDVIKPEDLNRERKKEEVEDDGVRIDQSGKMRDDKGNLVFVKKEARQLLVNKNKERDIKAREMQSRQRKRFGDSSLNKVLNDKNLAVGTGKSRVKRTIAGLNFIEEGSLQLAKRLYSAPTKEEPQSLSDLLVGENEPSVTQPPKPLVKKRARLKYQFKEMLPDKEWWDEPLLSCDNYKELWEVQKAFMLPLELVKADAITAEVQKGALFKEVQDDTVVMPEFLTKDEKKKLKRRRKQQRLKAKNDQIKLGLVEPDRPKLKFSNMALVMKDEYVLDPSRVEAEVKKQMKDRLEKHLQENASRKLTKQKKADKMLRKLKRDSAKQSRIAIFRIQSVKDRTARFKIQMNVKQLALNGLFLVPTEEFSGPAVVVVEGGRRAIKFFKNLMLRRINWAEAFYSNLISKQQAQKQTVDPQAKVELAGNKCRLVWEAVITDNSFNKWRSEFITCESDAIRLLSQRKLQHLWDSVVNFKDEV